MDNADAKFVERLFNEILAIEASRFRLPARKVAEGEDAPPARYAVMTVDDAVFVSVAQAGTLVRSMLGEGETE